MRAPMCQPPLTTEFVLEQGLQTAAKPAARQALRNPDQFRYLLDMFNQTVRMASGSSVDIGAGFASKATSTVGMAAQSQGAKGVVITAKAAQIILANAELLALGQKAGLKLVLTTVGATFMTKASLAFGMAGDAKSEKCIAAITDIGASGLSLVATRSVAISVLPVAGPALGVVNLAVGIAQLALAGYEAHQACISK